MRRPLAVVLLVAVSTVGARGGDEGGARNPRNLRWSGPVLEYVTVGRDEPGAWVQTIHLANPGTSTASCWVGRWEGLDPCPLLQLRGGERASIVSHTITPLAFDRRGDPFLPIAPRPIVLAVERPSDSGRWLPVDVATLPGPRTLTVAALVERRTYDEGNRRFGSFARRLRKSFEDLHRLFRDVRATSPGGLLPRAPIRDRFHLQEVVVYDSVDGGRPALFDDHPDVDVVIACDEGGPLAGFWLPQYSIGHNFLFPRDGPAEDRKGLWSAWGEQALWHELLHFRGVPDTYLFEVPAAALPGRASEAVPLPERYRLDLMNHPYQPPLLSALTAAIVNAKHGVERVGACEEPDEEHGHMWQWVPQCLRLAVRAADASPLLDATVRVWRSEPLSGLGDPRRQGVPEDAVARLVARPDVRGVVELGGDYLGSTDPRPRRSLWLLVEVERGRERRFDVVRLLELNEAWAAGHRGVWDRVLVWDDLRVSAH